jgi:phosphatidylserine/phosphatidylglycerophosphate/cardiolipin synthase-like enzyme
VIGHSRRRVRIASPVITSGPILGTLAEKVSDGVLDVAGIVDGPAGVAGVRPVARQRQRGVEDPAARAPSWRGGFAARPSTPWSPGSVHDFMHAKITVADDTSSSARSTSPTPASCNAENVLEIADAALADRLAAQIDAWRERYAGRP